MPIFLSPGPLNGVAPIAPDLGTFRGGGTIGRQSPSCGWDGVDVYSAGSAEVAYKITVDQQPMIDAEAGKPLAVKGEEFGKLIMGLRDDALRYCAARQAELSNWDAVAKRRTEQWFNASDDATRAILQKIIENVIRVLNKLKPSDFADYTDQELRSYGCVPPKGGRSEDANAAACPTDIEHHRIMIGPAFFKRPKYGFIFGTNEFDGRDSQLQTLIHEVTHFNDVAGSTDDYYGARNAITNKSRANIIKNADSLASYILGMNVKPMPSGEQ